MAVVCIPRPSFAVNTPFMDTLRRQSVMSHTHLFPKDTSKASEGILGRLVVYSTSILAGVGFEAVVAFRSRLSGLCTDGLAFQVVGLVYF